MSFPETIFGKCDECGATGGDKADASGADVPATDTTGNGVPLKEYDGKLLCDMCIKKGEADEETEDDTERRAEEESFRQKAGFAKSI